jgi:hypothetical protein
MKCEYCETTEDVHTLISTDRESMSDVHICGKCWKRGEDARLSQPLTLKPVETPYHNKMPRKKWDTPAYQFNPIAVGGIEQEIAALEREASYELNSSETRYIAEVKAYLLRHGYHKRGSAYPGRRPPGIRKDRLRNHTERIEVRTSRQGWMA